MASVRKSISLSFQNRNWSRRLEKVPKLTDELIDKGKSTVAYCGE